MLAKRGRDRIHVGRAGEHFVAYLLELAGLETSRVDGACDLHVTLSSGRILRVEVKTSSKMSKGFYKFGRNKSQADVYALVAIDEGPLVRFLPEAEIPRVTICIRDFTEELQAKELEWIAAME